MKDNWSNGSITAYNANNKTGVIRSFDGNDVIFHISHLVGSTTSGEENEPVPTVGQPAVFRVIETDAGFQAQEITLLNVKRK